MPERGRIKDQPLAPRERKGLPSGRPLDPPEWVAFLESLTTPAVGLSASHAREVRQVWAELRGAVGARLTLPMVEPVDEGAVCLSWSSASVYAEIEIRADGQHAWFIRDHETGGYDGSDGPEAGSPPRRLLQFLQAAFDGPR
jgi:hypothetical protein